MFPGDRSPEPQPVVILSGKHPGAWDMRSRQIQCKHLSASNCKENTPGVHGQWSYRCTPEPGCDSHRSSCWSFAQTQAQPHKGRGGERTLEQGGSQVHVRLFHLEYDPKGSPGPRGQAPGSHCQHRLTFKGNRQLELIIHE